MDAMEQSAAIQALAMSLAKVLSQDETARLGILLIQLGTTLDTIAALQELSGSGSDCDETQ